MARRKANTIAAHPGEILRTEFMEPMGITAHQLAKALHFPGVYEIVREQRAISADVALRLGKYFGMTPQFWMKEPIAPSRWMERPVRTSGWTFYFSDWKLDR